MCRGLGRFCFGRQSIRCCVRGRVGLIEVSEIVKDFEVAGGFAESVGSVRGSGLLSLTAGFRSVDDDVTCF